MCETRNQFSVYSAQINVDKIFWVDRSPGEVCPVEDCPPEFCPGEVYSPEDCLDEFCPAEVCLAEVCIA